MKITKEKLFLQEMEKIFSSFSGGRSSVDIQRAKYFTESFKTTEGESLSLRWAKALYHIYENKFLLIFFSKTKGNFL